MPPCIRIFDWRWAVCTAVMLLTLLGTAATGSAHGGTGAEPCAAPPQNLRAEPHAPFVPPAEGRLEVAVDIGSKRLMLLLNGYPIRTYRIAVGKSNTPSPVGQWRVIQKSRNWGDGFGSRWIGLNVPWGIYGIHGTNNPASIGQTASGGCIRMLNRDVGELYDLIPYGIRVTIYGGTVFHRRALVEGHRGADVLEVQMRLQELGYDPGPLDGAFGQATFRAVARFQQDRALQPTGIVRWDTYQALGLTG